MPGSFVNVCWSAVVIGAISMYSPTTSDGMATHCSRARVQSSSVLRVSQQVSPLECCIWVAGDSTFYFGVVVDDGKVTYSIIAVMS
jgi:hypothetical protein